MNDNEVKAMNWQYGAGNRLNTLERREIKSHVNTTLGVVNSQSIRKHSEQGRSHIKIRMTGRSKITRQCVFTVGSIVEMSFV